MNYFSIFTAMLFFSIAQLCGMEAGSANTDLSHIKQIIEKTGTPALKNKKDIPVIVDRIKKLSLTEKLDVNDPGLTQEAIQGITERFAITPFDAAAALKTEGAKKWVEQNIDPKEFELFKKFQKIRAIVNETAREFKQKYDFEIDDGQEGWPGSNPCYNQVENGLMLEVDSTPDNLWTPWGKVRITGGGCGRGICFSAFNLAILKRLKTTLALEPRTPWGSEASYFEVYEIMQREIPDSLDSDAVEAWKSTCTPISQEDAHKKVGTDVLLKSNICGGSAVYAVHAIDGSPVPAPKSLRHSQFRSSDVTHLIWDILEEKYKREFGGAEYKTSREKTEEWSKEWNDKHPVDLDEKEEYPLASIHELPQWTISLLQKCADSPEGKSFLGTTCRALPSKKYSDAQLLESMVSPQYKSGFFVSGNSTELRMELHGAVPEICFNPRAYEKTVKEIRTGWSAAKLVDYPDILHKESEENYYLYIKKSIFDVPALMALVALKLGVNLHKDIYISNNWECPKKGYKHSDTFYLWIKKDKLSDVVKKMDLVLK